MPADGSRLIARLQKAIAAAEASPAVLPDIALDTIAEVKANAASRLAGQQYQVGFDLDLFLNNISQPGRLHVTAPGVGRIGILDGERMGTRGDFDAIGEAGLFHQGTKDRKGIWRNVVYPDEELRQEVAEERQAVWGDVTPQWFLLEEGFAGAGAFPATPPHHFVRDATRPAAVIPRMLRAFTRIFRGI